MNKNQFLLTSKKGKSESLSEKIGSFNLFFGEGLEYNTLSNESIEIHLLGDIYDWENPKFTNSEILEKLVKYSGEGIVDLINSTNKYSGEYIIFLLQGEKVFLFNDACGQREVYYSDDFLNFGTQVKLIGSVCELVEPTDVDVQQFYQSEFFKKNKHHVGSGTHKKNIYHLRPNHFINVTEKKVERILFPEIKKSLSIDFVAQKASIMLRGYLEAISNRKKLIIGLTAGYDSRVIFLASLGIKGCKYYVNKLSWMSESHYDILIAKKLAATYGKELDIIDLDFKNIKFSSLDSKEEYIDSLDFPRFYNITNDTDHDEIIVNGNISEIARNYYGYHKRLNPKLLNVLNGNSNLKFAIKQYNDWLEGIVNLEKLGYNVLDLFYWEERMGNWQSKSRTELYALNRNLVSPFNSRDLLILLLMTERKNRDVGANKLYDKIIAELSNYNSEILHTPINPCTKTKVILMLKQFKLYNFYRAVIMKIALKRK